MPQRNTLHLPNWKIYCDTYLKKSDQTLEVSVVWGIKLRRYQTSGYRGKKNVRVTNVGGIKCREIKRWGIKHRGTKPQVSFFYTFIIPIWIRVQEMYEITLTSKLYTFRVLFFYYIDTWREFYIPWCLYDQAILPCSDNMAAIQASNNNSWGYSQIDKTVFIYKLNIYTCTPYVLLKAYLNPKLTSIYNVRA